MMEREASACCTCEGKHSKFEQLKLTVLTRDLKLVYCLMLDDLAKWTESK